MMPEKPNKTVQATAAVLGSATVVCDHSVVVADSGPLPAAVPDLFRSAKPNC